MRELRLVLLGLAALIAMALGTTFLMRAFRPPSPPAPSPAAVVPAAPPLVAGRKADAKTSAARAAIERAIQDAPDYARVFDRLRLAFPSDYETILSRLAAANAAAADINVDRLMLDTMTEMRRDHGAEMAKASDDALSRYFAQEIREVQALGASDPHLCVVFASGGGQAQDFLGFWADHRALVADAALATLDTMNSGRMDQVKRAVPSDDDLQGLDRALVGAGLPRPEISALLDAAPANPPIGDDEMCKAQQTYMTTIAGMPAAVRSRLYALMAKS